MTKQGREIKTQISDLFRTSYGTVDIQTLKSVYLNLSSWIEPIEPVEETSNWDRLINQLRFSVNNVIHKELRDTAFKDKAIVDLDLRASGIKKGKRSFMRCEVTMFLNKKNSHNIKSKVLLDKVTSITQKIINGPLLKSEYITFHNNKR
tara:strand:+ start:4403 stop:4849 length:447 start_codon:yes stop_codon:yes gene_type:complete